MHRARLVPALLIAAGLAACSSAPAPSALDQGPDGVSPSAAATLPPGSPGSPGSLPGATPGTTASGAPGAGTPSIGTAEGNAGGSTGSGSTGTGGSSGGTSGGTGSPVVGSGSTLFTPAENTIGLTPTSIRMCAHAALTYGKAFNTDTQDLNVFWTALNAEKGGIHGRKVEVTYENDNYSPDTAVTAAKTCVAKNIFMLLGGIGFDQIPTVRNYVEQAHVLYLHHTATVNGSKGLKYSFTELPTAERLGEGFAQLALQKFKGKRIGILKRDSTNWEPGVQAFKVMAKRHGITIVGEEKAAASAGNYTSQITNLKNAKADVVWIWLNALESTQVVKQIKAQVWSPNLMVFPFNLTSQTLGSDAMNPPMDGVAMYPAYSKGDYTGTFANYADDMKEFEAQYAKYDPNADLSSVGGDLLFLNWTAQKALYRQLLECGKDCTRNKFIDTLQRYHKTPISAGCPIDFRYGDRHHGAEHVTFMQTYNAPGGKVNWRVTQQCVGPKA